MKLQTLLLTMLVTGLPGLASAQAAAPASVTPPPSVSFVPCGSGGHQVTVFSEGTAWNRGRKAAWLTVYNPTGETQHVWVRIFVDGQDPQHPQEFDQSLAAHTRFAWHVNDELFDSDGPSRDKDFNFATEVFFEKVGVANLAVWELGSVGFPAYLRASYLKGTDLCAMW